MVSKLKVDELQLKRFEKFVVKVRSDCSSHAQFRKRFRKLTGKLNRRAAETSDFLRVVLLEDSLLASIISFGKLNEATSDFGNPIQLAFDAKILKIEYVNPFTRSRHTEENVFVRVVVEDRGINLIISVYPDRKNEIPNKDIPSVPIDRWE